MAGVVAGSRFMGAKAVALSLLILVCLGAISGEHAKFCVRQMTGDVGLLGQLCLRPACS